jgi:hypothetical protein
MARSSEGVVTMRMTAMIQQQQVFGEGTAF